MRYSREPGRPTIGRLGEEYSRPGSPRPTRRVRLSFLDRLSAGPWGWDPRTRPGLPRGRAAGGRGRRRAPVLVHRLGGAVHRLLVDLVAVLAELPGHHVEYDLVDVLDHVGVRAVVPLGDGGRLLEAQHQRRAVQHVVAHRRQVERGVVVAE